MRIDLKFIQLKEPLFLSGVNFGLKLTPQSKGGLEMFLTDITSMKATIIYKGEYCFAECSSVTLADPSQVGGPKPVARNLAVLAPSFPGPVQAQIGGPTSPFNAQVSDPTSAAPKKPGRPAKFQGQESQGE